MSERRKPRSGEVISGTHGKVWFDGDLTYEISSVELKIKTNRETIQFAGEMWEDSKLMSVSGTWSAKIKKTYSRAKKYAEALAKGTDMRSTIISKLNDPDNGGTERIEISNCWFDEVTLQQFENGKICEDELSGGFIGFKYLDAISDPCVQGGNDNE